MQPDLLRKSFRGSVRGGLRSPEGWKGGILYSYSVSVNELLVLLTAFPPEIAYK